MVTNRQKSTSTIQTGTAPRERYFPSIMKNPILLSLSLFACLSIAHAQDAKTDTDTLVAGEYTFEFSEPWVSQQPTSSMRAGELVYGSEEGAPVVVFFHFAGGGGGIQANIDRWIGQFEGTPEVSQTKEDIEGTTVHLLDASGTFMETMGGGPFSGPKKAMEDYKMLAAILESDRGPVFLKVTGPSDKVAEMKEAFTALVKSALD